MKDTTTPSSKDKSEDVEVQVDVVQKKGKKKRWDIDGKFLLVKVGSEAKPASNEDIKNVQQTLSSLFEKNSVECLYYVTHNNVAIEIIG